MADTMAPRPLDYNPLAALIDGRNKDRDARLRRFIHWLGETGAAWHSPDLAAYRDRLSASLRASSVAANLATIRGAYRDLATSNAVRDWLFQNTPDHLSIADRFALVNEAITRLQNATDPKAAPVKVATVQDAADSDHMRLTEAQAIGLIDAPGVDDLRGLRDTALIALLLCTGIREGEAAGLLMDDLRQSLGGELALRVTEGKGKKQRLIPYGDLNWCLVIVDAWLLNAGISSGPVFRGIRKDGTSVRAKAMTTRAIQQTLARYPIAVNGNLVSVRPHDLRRSYARLQYEAGMAALALQQNLGHTRQETTQHYIGTLDASRRRAKAAIRYALGKLRTQGDLFEGDPVPDVNSVK